MSNKTEIDLNSIDGLVKALYQGISFAPRKQPEYKMLELLFHSNALVTPPKGDTGGVLTPMTARQFITSFDKSLKSEGLIELGATEEEVGRQTLVFQRTALVASSYHFTVSGSDTPVARGVNSLQLVFDQDRWWILSLAWDRPKQGEPLAIQYSEYFTDKAGK